MELGNVEDTLHDVAMGNRAGRLDAGLTMVSDDLAIGPVQYDPRRGRTYQRCAEWVDGKWEGFVALERKNETTR